MASARRTLSSVGVVIASSYALVWSECSCRWKREQRLEVVRMSFERDLLGVERSAAGLDWYLSFCDRSLPPYLSRIARARSGARPGRAPRTRGHMPWRRRTTGSGAKSSMCIPRDR